MVWSQVYDPMNNMWLSTLLGAIPIVVLLGAIGLLEIKAHIAAAMGLVAALAIAVVGYGMPAGMAGTTALYGAAYGLLPIGWIILNVIFLYRLTEEAGLFSVLRDSIAAITRDRRLQLLFIAFSFAPPSRARRVSAPRSR
jgi:lactate permease